MVSYPLWIQISMVLQLTVGKLLVANAKVEGLAEAINMCK